MTVGGFPPHKFAWSFDNYRLTRMNRERSWGEMLSENLASVP